MASFIEAAEIILSQSDEPLSVDEITDRALQQGILKSDGKTPESTMSAVIGNNMREKDGGSQFIKTAPNTFDLRNKHASASEQVTSLVREYDTNLDNPVNEDRLPKHHETYNIILKTLSEHGMMHHLKIRKKIRDEYYANVLSEDILNTTSGKHKKQTILGRMHFGIMDLVCAKMIRRPKIGMIEIADKGAEIIKSGQELTYNDIKNDLDYIDVMATAKHKKELNNNNKSSEIDVSFTTSDNTPTEIITEACQKIENGVKGELLDTLTKVNPYGLERIVLELFSKMGYGVLESTSKSHGGGIDGIIHQDILGLDKIYFQVKRYTDNKINAKAIHEFAGAIMANKGTKGIFVTTSDFNKKSLEGVSSLSLNIELINGDKLVDLMYKHGCGVEVEESYQVKKIDEGFFEEYS